MPIEQEIDELQDMVSPYDLESFAGFFSYFIRDSKARAINTSLSLFDSKARDFLYLIGLKIHFQNIEVPGNSIIKIKTSAFFLRNSEELNPKGALQVPTTTTKAL